MQGDGSVAVIIRFYAADKAKDDLVNHLRTVIFETERRGYHAYIFYEVKVTILLSFGLTSVTPQAGEGGHNLPLGTIAESAVVGAAEE